MWSRNELSSLAKVSLCVYIHTHTHTHTHIYISNYWKRNRDAPPEKKIDSQLSRRPKKKRYSTLNLTMGIDGDFIQASQGTELVTEQGDKTGQDRGRRPYYRRICHSSRKLSLNDCLPLAAITQSIRLAPAECALSPKLQHIFPCLALTSFMHCRIMRLGHTAKSHATLPISTQATRWHVPESTPYKKNSWCHINI